jgi:hypothetical protein
VKCYEWAVAATKAVGRGRIYYYGTILSASIAAGDLGGIEVLRSVFPHVIQPPISRSGKLRPRIIRASQRGLLTVSNDTDQPRTAMINLPAGYYYVLDTYTAWNAPSRRIRLNSLFLLGVFDLE